ncbi:MAG: hypothetical protein ACKO4K_06910 [Flavobacteriales bacterium]|jgi:hypothetical protein
MQRLILANFLSFILLVNGQSERKFNPAGMLSLGGRTTVSLFNDHKNEMTGTGVGGQFRLRFADAVNTDWFFDYITSDILNYAHRTDYHIGWSVLYYPINHLSYYHQREVFKPKWRPYILAGHCFDYSKIEAKDGTNSLDGPLYAERWSSAVQAGLGTHLELSPRFDLSLTGQYMIHLGNHIETEYDFTTGTLNFLEHKGTSLAGHLLVTLSLNYKIAKLWGFNRR